MAEIPIFSPLVTHVPEVGKTSKFFWYILRWTRHHKKKFKFLGQKRSEICKVKYRDFQTFSYILHPIDVCIDVCIDRCIDRDGFTHVFSEASVGQTKDSRWVGFVLGGR